MGNDIKLPVSHRNQVLQSKKASEAEQKIEINREMSKISKELAHVNNSIGNLEHNLQEINKNIEYYKNLITDIYVTLHQIENEQLNALLNQEKFRESARTYLESLENVPAPLDDQIKESQYSEKIQQMEADLQQLNQEISNNEAYIDQKLTELQSNN